MAALCVLHVQKLVLRQLAKSPILARAGGQGTTTEFQRLLHGELSQVDDTSSQLVGAKRQSDL